MIEKLLPVSPKAIGLLSCGVILAVVAITLVRADEVRAVSDLDGVSANPASNALVPAEPAAPRTAGDDVPKRTSPPPSVKSRKGTDANFELEKRLSELGYWTGPVDGILDVSTKSAIVAFQKVEELKRTGRLSAGDLAVLRQAKAPSPLESGYRHIEVDISRQVLFFVDEDGTVSRVLPVSTGNGKRFTVNGLKDVAYTPRGRCTVYRKIAGERVAPLGSLYYPNYLVGGIAIHGSPSIPPVPASHGCVRIPMWACKAVSELTPVGTVVLLHDGGSFANERSWLKQVARSQPANFNESMATPR